MSNAPVRPASAAADRRRWIFLALIALASPFVAVLAISLNYERSSGGACASCHEIWQPYSDWHRSSHRNVRCSECHGDVFILDAGFHLNNLRRVFTHLSGKSPESPKLRTADVFKVGARCEKCHQAESAEWQASAHSVTYQRIFLDAKHNQREILTDDCLRCHGMHFEGPMRDLVKPLNTAGPWQLRNAALSDQPAIPCLSCHQIHHEGLPLQKLVNDQQTPNTRQEISRPSVGLFDRRELHQVPLADLPLPKMLDETRDIKISPDQRQALCYQCHAPLPSSEVRSGDDRTPIGVHEGLSCMSCHAKHGLQTRASCSTCHPRLSNCGLDVEKMDTTFKDKNSKQNVHFVKCQDCHTKGIPKKIPPGTSIRPTR
jgi:hypothetical protein